MPKTSCRRLTYKERIQIHTLFYDSGWSQIHNGRYPIALNKALLLQKIKVIKLLLDCGAEVKIADNNGRTSLHFAAQNGHEAVVKPQTGYEALCYAARIQLKKRIISLIAYIAYMIILPRKKRASSIAKLPI
jgi:hypothetical protein